MHEQAVHDLSTPTHRPRGANALTQYAFTREPRF